MAGKSANYRETGAHTTTKNGPLKSQGSVKRGPKYGGLNLGSYRTHQNMFRPESVKQVRLLWAYVHCIEFRMFCLSSFLILPCA